MPAVDFAVSVFDDASAVPGLGGARVEVFIFGTVVGSFLNVCIHRMPLGESVVFPPSHCPHCNYSIPWYLNMPLITWLYLRGRCANCRATISVRYFLVELLTGVLFAVCWVLYGHISSGVAVVYCIFVAGLIAATFIDFEHFIIPDEITVGGVAVAVACSYFVPSLQTTFPDMHRLVGQPGSAVYCSIWGAGFGAILVYAIVRGGKLLFGRKKIEMSYIGG